MKSISWLFVACALGASAHAQPPGYHIGAASTLPDSLAEVFAHGRFRATVLRVAANADEARLIRAAEQLYPAPDSIIASARNAGERNRLLEDAAGVSLLPFKVPQRAAGTPADRWWLDYFDGTWIPYSVTGGAIEYYLERLHDYAAGRSPFGFDAVDGKDNASLSYTARVLPSTDVGTTHLVELRLSWEYWCGDMCAMGFRHTRRVFFDGSGRAVRVEGDGRPEVIVS